MQKSWSDIRVLVTGGSQGIGLGIAESFARAGAQVVISGRVSSRLEVARERLAGQGLEVGTAVADVSRQQGCREMAARADELLGGLDVLCANAGVYPEQRIADLTGADVDHVLDTNIKGTIYAVQASSPPSPHQGEGGSS